MNDKRGFTLVELLVVIAIIALLLSILMPALQKVRKQARLVVDQSNLSQLAMAAGMYTNDNTGKFWIGPFSVTVGTPGTHIPNPNGAWYEGPPQSWVVALKPYYKDIKLRCCPEAPQNKPRWDDAGRPSFQLPYASWRNTVTSGNNWFTDLGDITSYGENQWICEGTPQAWSGATGTYKDYFWKKITNLRSVNNVPMLFDSMNPSVKTFVTDMPPEIPEISANTDQMQSLCTLRHDGQMNLVFADFSIRRTGLKDAWWFKWHAKWPCDKNGNLAAPPNNWPGWMNKLRNQKTGG